MVLSASFSYLFQHPWSVIAGAIWRKYPSPKQPDIIHWDFIDKEYNPTTGIFRAKRLIIINPDVPFWIKLSRLCPQYLFFIECSTIDPVKRIITLHNTNYSLREYGMSEEICTYRQLDNNFTELKQEIKIECSRSSYIEKYIFNRYCSKINVGPTILEDVIIKCNAHEECR